LNYLKRQTKRLWLILLFLTPTLPLLSEESQISPQHHHGQELISLNDCLIIANEEIAILTDEAKDALVKAVMEAVANERKDLLPIIAGLEEEVAQWKAEAMPSFWDEHGLAVAGVSLVMGSIVTSILFSFLQEKV